MKVILLVAGVIAVAAVTQVHGWAALPVHARILMCVAVDLPFILAYLAVARSSARKARAAASARRSSYTTYGGGR